MRIIDAHFPVIITVTSSRLEVSEVEVLSSGFERFFQRGERYAVLGLTEGKFRVPDIAARTALQNWVNHPRVRDYSGRLCVGTAAVNDNVLHRIAFNLVMTFSKAVSETAWFGTPQEAVDFCIERIRVAKLSTPQPLDLIRNEVLKEAKRIIDPAGG
jgi:hypothetical protein